MAGGLTRLVARPVFEQPDLGSGRDEMRSGMGRRVLCYNGDETVNLRGDYGQVTLPSRSRGDGASEPGVRV